MNEYPFDSPEFFEIIELTTLLTDEQKEGLLQAHMMPVDRLHLQRAIEEAEIAHTKLQKQVGYLLGKNSVPDSQMKLQF